MTKSRHLLPPRRRWTDAELDVLRAQFADNRTDDLAKTLGRSYAAVAGKAAHLGLRKSTAYLASPAAHRLDGLKGMGTRFQPGVPSWSKGTKGRVGVQPGCRATQFKPGRLPHEARNYLPIGSLRITHDGYLERKVTDDPKLAPARRWTAVHRLVWEAEHGPTPRGQVVVFKVGRRTTDEAQITLDAVECITRAQLMKRNTFHNWPAPLPQLVQLSGALTRQIRKREKAEA